MKTVGIIGFNGFGEFLASKLTGHCDIKVSSRTPDLVPSKWRASLEEVARCDYLVLSIPLSAYDTVLHSVMDFIPKDTVLVDICSVKVKPVEILNRLAPSNRKVITHPLFGPQSAAESLDNHTIVICDGESDGEQSKIVQNFCKTLGLKVVLMSADRHDREMAAVHALTFFVARALVAMDVHASTLRTPSFQRILDLADLERHHTDDLFRTIQLSNLYAGDVRQAFIDAAETLNQSLLK